MRAQNATPPDHAKVLRAKNILLTVGVSTVVDDLFMAAQEGWADEDLRQFLKRLVPDFDASRAGMPMVKREQ